MDTSSRIRSDRRINLKNKKITILGMARSGIAAAKRLSALGAKVMISEVRSDVEVDPELNVTIELGGHTDKALNADLIVVSPGIHLDIPVLEKAKQEKIPIVSEIEIAYQILKKPIVAVTGTNGKTTTTTLISEMLKAGGKKAAVAGNIGYPLVAVDDTDLDYIVAEISSYQLETVKDFKPWISVILNVQEDHIERHGSLENYINQKANIFKNQNGDDYVIFNEEDKRVVEMVRSAKAKLVGFSKNDHSIITLNKDEIKIPGVHNLENALAATQAAYLCGVERKVVADVLRTFPGVEHRIEPVKDINGISFYNDSKATNPDSTLVALDTFKGKSVILILGGKDKGTKLDVLCKKVKEGVKAVILIGEATVRFKQALEQTGYSEVKLSGSMEEAVKLSFDLGEKGDIVLLSPACASFDMFKNFEERGKVFKKVVARLA